MRFLKRSVDKPVFKKLYKYSIIYQCNAGGYRGCFPEVSGFLGVEYEADTIKKVYIRSTDGTIEKEVYVLSLIEHKSEIDYDVAMQLFRYMSVIWQDYKATQNKKHKGVSASADFRYPLIIPIVYYEGRKSGQRDCI